MSHDMRELAAAAQAEAVDHGDHRLGEGRHDVEDARAAHGVALVERRAAGELGDVGAGDERLLARAGDDDDADRVVVLDLGERGEQLVAHLLVQGVQLVGAVDGEDGDAALALAPGWSSDIGTRSMTLARRESTRRLPVPPTGGRLSRKAASPSSMSSVRSSSSR